MCGPLDDVTNIAFAEQVINLMPHGSAGKMLGLLFYCSLIAIVKNRQAEISH